MGYPSQELAVSVFEKLLITFFLSACAWGQPAAGNPSTATAGRGAPPPVPSRSSVQAAIKNCESKASTTDIEVCLRSLVKTNPSTAGYAAALLNFLVSVKAVEKAEPVAKAFVARWPHLPEILAAHGRFLAHKNETEGSREQYRRASLLARDKNGFYLREFATALQESGNHEQAIDVLKQRMSVVTPTPADHVELARLLRQRKRWVEAADEVFEADRRDTLPLHSQQFAQELEDASEIEGATHVYLKIVNSGGTGASLAGDRLFKLLHARQEWPRLISICAATINRASSGLDPIRIGCEESIKALSSANKGEIAFQIYGTLRKAQEILGGSSLLGPLASWAANLARARARAGAADDVAELCGPGGIINPPGCDSVIKEIFSGRDVDFALRLYQLLVSRENLNGYPPLVGPLAEHRATLTTALALQGRFDEAVGLCSVPRLAYCDSAIMRLFKTGERGAAVELYMKNAQRGGISIMPDLDVVDELALRAAEARTEGDPTSMFAFFARLSLKHNIVEIERELRKSGAGIDFGPAIDLHNRRSPVLHSLMQRGAFEWKVIEATPLLDRACNVAAEVLKPGQHVKMAFVETEPGGFQCKNQTWVVVTEYGNHVWGIDATKARAVVGDSRADYKLMTQTSAQMFSRMVLLGGIGEAELLDEVSLGMAAEQEILTKYEAYTDAEASQTGTRAFRDLLATSQAGSGSVRSFQLFLLKNDSVNAFSTAGGRIFVNRGALPIVENKPGMWAALIAHEVAHIVARHQYNSYLRTIRLRRLQDDLRKEAGSGNKIAQWAWIFSKTGGPLLNLKFSRDEELQADRIGLVMMAEAGYHPNYVLELMDQFKKQTGDRSKIGTFFGSDHPRWETREKRVKAAYAEALKVFSSRWPDASKSPGGVPSRP